MNGTAKKEGPPPSARRRLSETDEVSLEKPRVNGLTNGYPGTGTDDDDEDEDDVRRGSVAPTPTGEEDPGALRVPSPPMKELSPEELAQKMKLVHQLQVELRNEEMKLVLLKKLRQSQVRLCSAFCQAFETPLLT